jgi:hypothetical protein
LFGCRKQKEMIKVLLATLALLAAAAIIKLNQTMKHVLHGIFDIFFTFPFSPF